MMRDYSWHIHLLSELVLPSINTFHALLVHYAAIVSYSTTVILLHRKINITGFSTVLHVIFAQVLS